MFLRSRLRHLGRVSAWPSAIVKIIEIFGMLDTRQRLAYIRPKAYPEKPFRIGG
jgi:hypothetical protein